MRIASFTQAGHRRVGVVANHEIFDLTPALGPQAQDAEAFFSMGAPAWAEAARALNGERGIPLSEVVLEAPVRRPGKFLALASNYQAHVREILETKAIEGYVAPDKPKWFNKQVTCITGPRHPIELPRVSDQVDYEAELAVVIGTRCRHVAVEDAPRVIGGYTVCNDVSVRDWQRHSNTITIGKSFDTHGPLGPWLVTPDEVGDPHALRIRCWVNGELRQDGNTSEMVHNCYDLIAYLSQVCTLEPGDIIATGTPAGVGALMTPPRFLAVGDVVRCEVEKIGAIENRVIAEPTTVVGAHAPGSPADVAG